MGGNYTKNMFRQLEDALLKVDELSDRVNRIEAETANKYLQIIYEKDQEIARLRAENAEQKERIAKLEAEVDRLRKQLNNDSGNSSNPPSSDIKPNAPSVHNGRTKTGKKSGGQKGHKGKHLSRASIEEKIARGQMKRRVVNHGAPIGGYTSKFVIDLKIETVAIEHRFYGDAEIPFALRPEVQYGSELKAFVVTLAGQGLVASNRIADMLSAFTDDALALSEGTIYNFLSELNVKAAAFIGNTKTKLLNNSVLYVDETGAICFSEITVMKSVSYIQPIKPKEKKRLRMTIFCRNLPAH